MLHCISTIASTITTPSPTYFSPPLWQAPIPNWVVFSENDAPWYLDALKAAPGSLFGAGAAFFFAVLHRWMQENNTNLRAGNLALFKLRAIQRRTGDIRLGIRHEITEVRKYFPEAPPWAILKPVMLSMDDIEFVDLDNLSFLLDSESGKEAIKHVKFVEEIFANFKSTVALHQEAAVEYQKATVDLYRSNRNGSYEQIGEHIGPELLARRKSLFFSILQNVEQNPAINKVAFMKLEAALQKHFRNRVWRRFHDRVWKLDFDFEPSSPRAESNLPPLPEDLKKIVAAFPS